MSDPTKIERGVKHGAMLIEARNRRWSEPILDEFLPLAKTAGLVVDDNDHNVTLYSAGKKYGAAWGPSVEGNWFANRDAGLRHVLDAKAVPA